MRSWQSPGLKPFEGRGNYRVTSAEKVALRHLPKYLESSRAVKNSIAKGASANSQHHKNQLGLLWEKEPRTASIMGISWAQGPQTTSIMSVSLVYFGRKGQKQPASSQHHEHELGIRCAQGSQTTSIMSLSWAYFGAKAPPSNQHHERQLGLLWSQGPEAASIMSISWAYFGRKGPKPPAS